MYGNGSKPGTHGKSSVPSPCFLLDDRKERLIACGSPQEVQILDIGSIEHQRGPTHPRSRYSDPSWR